MPKKNYQHPTQLTWEERNLNQNYVSTITEKDIASLERTLAKLKKETKKNREGGRK